MLFPKWEIVLNKKLRNENYKKINFKKTIEKQN